MHTLILLWQCKFYLFEQFHFEERMVIILLCISNKYYFICWPTIISYLQLITYHLLYVRKYFDDIHNCSNNVSLLTLSQHSNVISIFLLNESSIEYRTSENNWTLVMDKLLANAVIRRAFWNLCIRKWYV